MRNAMIIEPADNVVVAIEPIHAGETICYTCGSEEKVLTALEDITIYHKAAAVDIRAGEPVIKYGEHIGAALCNIKAGEHVHTHNVEGRREDLSAR